MITIPANPKYNDFISEYSKKLTLNGFSNLSASDLKKATRQDFQIQSLVAEIAWREYRYKDASPIKEFIDKKLAHYEKTKQGDGGEDDILVYKGHKRTIDIKSSFTDDINKIQHLNLIIPEREFHTEKPMIYVCAFVIGKDRKNIEQTIFPGWCFDFDVVSRWGIDKSKWCVKVPFLREMKELEKYIRFE